MTEKQFREEYMGKKVSDTEIIDFLQREKQNLKKKNIELEKENKVLKQIIQDLLAHTDGCECCTAKGQHAPACECMHDAECVEHMIKLYTEVK